MPSPRSTRCTRPISSRPSRVRYTLAIPILAPPARRPSWIPCAETQHPRLPRNSTTTRRAPPLRPLSDRRRPSAVSIQTLLTDDNDTHSQRPASVRHVPRLVAVAVAMLLLLLAVCGGVSDASGS